MSTAMYFIAADHPDEYIITSLDWFVEAESPEQALELYRETVIQFVVDDLDKTKSATIEVQVYALPALTGVPHTLGWHTEVKGDHSVPATIDT